MQILFCMLFVLKKLGRLKKRPNFISTSIK